MESPDIQTFLIFNSIICIDSLQLRELFPWIIQQ